MPRQLRIEYPGVIYHVMNRKWIAEELKMGSWTYVASRLNRKNKIERANAQNQLNLV
jgi:hypothetical protein